MPKDLSMKRVKIYTKDACYYCVRAKELLTQRGVDFQEIYVAWENDALWDELFKRSGMRTMPQIFFTSNEDASERLIGGYRELADLDKEDQLMSLKR